MPRREPTWPRKKTIVHGTRRNSANSDASPRGVYNPLIAGQLAWDLGNNWGFSYLLGAYIDVNSEVAWSDTSLNQRFALSYTGNQLNLTANVIWGTHFDHVTGRSQLSSCPAPFALHRRNPD